MRVKYLLGHSPRHTLQIMGCRRAGCSVAEAAGTGWEAPPGAGVCALDTLFGAANTAANWLAQRSSCLVVCDALMSQ